MSLTKEFKASTIKVLGHWKKILKKILEDRKIAESLWDSRINIIKMTILPKAFYKFNAIPIATSVTLFKRNRKEILKFKYKYERPQIVK